MCIQKTFSRDAKKEKHNGRLLLASGLPLRRGQDGDESVAASGLAARVCWAGWKSVVATVGIGQGNASGENHLQPLDLGGQLSS